MGRQIGHHGIGGARKAGQSIRIMRELVRIDEAAVGFLERVTWQRISIVKLWRDGLGKSAHQAMNLCLGGLIAGGGVIARQPREILSKGVTWNVAGHVVRRIEFLGPAIPAAHVRSRRGQAAFWRKGLSRASSSRARKN